MDKWTAELARAQRRLYETQRALYRSTLEGISVAMARNLAGRESATGVPLREVMVVGGGRRALVQVGRQVAVAAAR